MMKCEIIDSRLFITYDGKEELVAEILTTDESIKKLIEKVLGFKGDFGECVKLCFQLSMDNKRLLEVLIDASKVGINQIRDEGLGVPSTYPCSSCEEVKTILERLDDGK